MDGFYRVTIAGAAGEDGGALALVRGKLVGADLVHGICYRGTYSLTSTGAAQGWVTISNESGKPVKTVMGTTLEPDRPFSLPFEVSNAELRYSLTFRTPFGPVVLQLQLVDSL